MKPLYFVFLLFISAFLELWAMPVNAQDPPPTSYQQRLEQSWQQVKKDAVNESLPLNLRIKALQKFLADFPSENRHDVYAHKLIATLEYGELQIEDGYLVPLVAYKYNPIKSPEWFTLQAGVGRFGVSGKVGLVTLRWRYFYWNIAQFVPTMSSKLESLLFGTELGVPLHIGTKQKDEIRIGIAVQYGSAWFYLEKVDHRSDGRGLILVPTFKYVHRVGASRFKFIGGIDFPIYPNVETYLGDGAIDYSNQIGVVGFLGFAI